MAGKRILAVGNNHTRAGGPACRKLPRCPAALRAALRAVVVRVDAAGNLANSKPCAAGVGDVVYSTRGGGMDVLM